MIVLTQTDTSTRAAQLQSVVLTDPLILELATLVFGTLQGRKVLSPGGKKGFDKRFAALARHLKIGHLFSPACLRGGGAVEYFERTGNLGELQYRGRWEAQKSMLHYLQQGMATTVWATLDPDTRSEVFGLAACAPLLVPAARARWSRARPAEG